MNNENSRDRLSDAVLRALVWGFLRGLESFSQLVYQDYNLYYVNKTEIEDFPQFPFRGLLLNTKALFTSTVNAILKTLVNTFLFHYVILFTSNDWHKIDIHWHIVDDPSFPYKSHSYPDLSNKGAFHSVTHVYMQSDVRRVIVRARSRGIRVVPEFDSPGHTESWGGQPDLLTPCYRRIVPTGTFGSINPMLRSNYQFMSSLLKEVTSVFPDSFVHLGGDDVDIKCWKSNSSVQAFIGKTGFGDDTKLESYMESIMNIKAAFNKTSIVQAVFDYHKQRRAQYVVEVWKRRCYLYKMKVILGAPIYLDLPGLTHDWARFYNVHPLL
ncbi:LOW QUALITY PROTEIN: beta-hexosaminidase subunit alpha [Clarias gariepinus]